MLQGSVEERIIEVGRHRRAGGRLGGGASGGDQERIRGNSFWYGADEYYRAPVPEHVRPCWHLLHPTLPYPNIPHCTAAWPACVSPLVPSSGVLADARVISNDSLASVSLSKPSFLSSDIALCCCVVQLMDVLAALCWQHSLHAETLYATLISWHALASYWPPVRLSQGCRLGSTTPACDALCLAEQN